MDVSVLGGGVSGLTCGVALAARGHTVRLFAERLGPDTTSSVAAAFWYPYKADPPDRVLAWARASLHEFRQLESDPRAGVRSREVIELVDALDVRPWWAPAVDSLRPADRARLPAGQHAAWAFDAPVIDTRVYLPFLLDRLARTGASIATRRLDALVDAPGDVVVNCTGLGAGRLCDDDELFAIRGQLVHVADPGIDTVWIDERAGRGITYVVPRGDDCVLGGTAEIGALHLSTDPQQADDILQRARGLVPALAGAEVTGHRVGLRPGRSTVRLGAERLVDGRTVVHDYGHGGAGVTLSWGCAAEVCALVEASRAPSR
jgi:D-amino-acid oxidase